jgi:hypothetical protein
VLGELGTTLSDHLGDGAAGVMLEVPFGRNDGRAEALDLRLVGDQLAEQVAQVPLIEDPADVEDDGFDSVRQPWRALKRRLVLLIT